MTKPKDKAETENWTCETCGQFTLTITWQGFDSRPRGISTILISHQNRGHQLKLNGKRVALRTRAKL